MSKKSVEIFAYFFDPYIFDTISTKNRPFFWISKKYSRDFTVKCLFGQIFYWSRQKRILSYIVVLVRRTKAPNPLGVWGARGLGFKPPTD